MLYPKPVLASGIAKDASLANKISKFLNGIKVEDLLGKGRVYGCELHKLEPRELANVPADVIIRLAHIPLKTKKSMLYLASLCL